MNFKLLYETCFPSNPHTHIDCPPLQAPDLSIIPSADRCSCQPGSSPSSIHSAAVYPEPSVNAMCVSVARLCWSHAHTAHLHALFTPSSALHLHAFTITRMQTRGRQSMSERNQIVMNGSPGTHEAGHATQRSVLHWDLRSAETGCVCCGTDTLFGIGSAVHSVCSQVSAVLEKKNQTFWLNTTTALCTSQTMICMLSTNT